MIVMVYEYLKVGGCDLGGCDTNRVLLALRKALAPLSHQRYTLSIVLLSFGTGALSCVQLS